MTIIETCPECGAELLHIDIATNPPIHAVQCLYCGYKFEYPRDDDIIRVPFQEPKSEHYDPCGECNNNPQNGGSGICHCILGTPSIT